MNSASLGNAAYAAFLCSFCLIISLYPCLGTSNKSICTQNVRGKKTLKTAAVAGLEQHGSGVEWNEKSCDNRGPTSMSLFFDQGVREEKATWFRQGVY